MVSVKVNRETNPQFFWFLARCFRGCDFDLEELIIEPRLTDGFEMMLSSPRYTDFHRNMTGVCVDGGAVSGLAPRRRGLICLAYESS
jgi:hypothetical protein